MSLKIQYICTLILGLALVLLSNGCHEQEPDPIPSIHTAEGFFIVNEGTFNFGNASVSYYNYKTKEVTHDLFKTANGHTAGDVLQHLYVEGNKGYLVLNNSGYLEVVNIETFESEGLIQPFESPRYFLPVSDQKAYVSDLYSNSIQVVNLADKAVTGSINMPFWTEQMEKVGTYIFVTAPWDIRVDAHDFIYVLDSSTDMLIDSIQTGYDPVTLALDGENKLWVYCRGAEDLGEPAGLYCVNTETRAVERSLPFSDYDLGFAARLAFNAAGDTLYFLKKDVYAFPLNNPTLSNTPLIQANGKNFYALAVNPESGQLVAGDAIDYAQKGKVYIYNTEGNLLETLEAGVIPSHFVFY